MTDVWLLSVIKEFDIADEMLLAMEASPVTAQQREDTLTVWQRSVQSAIAHRARTPQGRAGKARMLLAVDRLTSTGTSPFRDLAVSLAADFAREAPDGTQ